jgi:MoxR-like ATPase
LEGTYPLPEAQLDRFLLNPVIQYLPEADEIRMVGDTTGAERPLPEAVLSGPEIETLQYLTRQVPAPESVVSYAVRLVSASRPGEDGCDPWMAERIKWGAGSRGSQALVLSAKARALLNGRPNASRDDIRAMAKSALRHRILPSFLAESEGLSSDDLIDRLLDQVSE